MRLNFDTKIAGDKVVFVPYRKDHVKKYHSWMEDDELREQTASLRLSLDEEYKMQQDWFHDDNKCTFIVLDSGLYISNCYNEIDSMIGDVNLFLTVNDETSEIEGELSLMIAEPAFRSQGKGFQTILLMMRYGIEMLKVNKFIVKISENNPASLALFEKLNFVLEDENQIFKEKTLGLNVTSSVLEWLQSDQTLPCYKMNKTEPNF